MRKHPQSIDIVIPVLNEENHLATMLTSLFDAIANEDPTTYNVFVVDGGSSDRTVEIARKFNCNVLNSAQKGRGRQIAHGVQAGKGDLIVMLHADAVVHPGAFNRLLKAFNDAPNLCWGVLGHNYDSTPLRLRIVRAMNRARFKCTGIAFGDQGIFVRRETLEAAGGIPELPLMEDVEISIRLKQFPATNLGENLTISARRWSNQSYCGYFLQMFSYVIMFLIKRKLSYDMTRVTEDLYLNYYRSKEDETTLQD